MKYYLDDPFSQCRFQGELGSLHLVVHIPGKAGMFLNMSFPHTGEVKAIRHSLGYSMSNNIFHHSLYFHKLIFYTDARETFPLWYECVLFGMCWSYTYKIALLFRCSSGNMVVTLRISYNFYSGSRYTHKKHICWVMITATATVQV